MESDEPLLVASLLDTPTKSRHMANLSTAPGRGAARPSGADPEAEAFRTLASPVVQSKCVNCHVEGGASGDSRLVFVPDADPDHLSKNLQAFKRLLESVNDATGDGADYVLGKIQGVSHGGGVQAAAGTDDFAAIERFLGVLEGRDSGPVTITPANLFEGVAMEMPRSTLRRAAIIFAGRTPTDAEYESIKTGGTSTLRQAIRELMTGQGFHDFLIRGANDQAADGSGRSLSSMQRRPMNSSSFRICTTRSRLSGISPEERWRWFQACPIRNLPVASGVDCAHVAKSDLPYTEVLTADYIMANPLAAQAYGASTVFDDPEDLHEFKPSQIVSYYRDDDSKVADYSLELGTQVTESEAI